MTILNNTYVFIVTIFCCQYCDNFLTHLPHDQSLSTIETVSQTGPSQFHKLARASFTNWPEPVSQPDQSSFYWTFQWGRLFQQYMARYKTGHINNENAAVVKVPIPRLYTTPVSGYHGDVLCATPRIHPIL